MNFFICVLPHILTILGAVGMLILEKLGSENFFVDDA